MTQDNLIIPPINTELLDRIMERYNKHKNKLGLKIHVHNPEHLVDGQIFLYNHFARFETVIPHYINHQLANAYTRTIADKHLFKVSKKFTKFLLETGAVPNHKENLLPFLAAEILRGRKVVIFPEGGIVKTRKVLDDKGNYSIWSGKAGTFRKHHKGAAVLALTLDLFKQRIMGLFDDEDMPRLEHWRSALGMNTLEELKEAAEKPTLVVPGNITFYPIRISENFISRILKRIKKDLPESLLEEVIIEGNLIFKDTDMNIHYSQPIKTTKTLNWAEQALLKRHFLHNVHSLDELFSLNKVAKTWPEKFLARFMTRETDKIRDLYMQGLYTGITINLNHIASRLIFTLYENGVRHISLKEFCRTLYIAIKYLQSQENVHTHYSIAWPSHYRELLQGRTPDLKQFLKTCEKAGLVKKDKTNRTLIFLDKIEETPDRTAIRRNNPIKVYVNEAEPIPAVAIAVDEAVSSQKDLPEEQLSDYLFDDELRDFTQHHEEFTQFESTPSSLVQKYPGRIPETLYGTPYFLPSAEAQESRIGVILVHGFLGAPAQLKAFGEHLNRQGHTVVGVRLAGHGTSMHDLQNRSHTEWVNNIKTAYNTIAPSCKKVVLIGFSTGAVVNALMAATVEKARKKDPEAYAKLSGIVFVSAPVSVQDKNMNILPFIQCLNTITQYTPFIKRPLIPFYKYSPSQPRFQYPYMPVHAINELRLSIKGMKRALKHISIPALILQGKVDPTVVPSSAPRIYKYLSSKQKTLHWIDTDQHNLIGKNVGPTWQLIEEFIDNL